MTRPAPRRGAVIVIIALLLPVLFIIVGFSIDLAMMQCAKTELRTATDLAAKSAANELARTNSTSSAVTRGQQIALANLVSGTGLHLDATDFEFGNTTTATGARWNFSPGGVPTNAVRITGARGTSEPDGPVGLFFGSLHGVQNFAPSVAATAGFQNTDLCLVLDRSSSMKLRIDESGGMPGTDPRACLPPQVDARWMLLDAAINSFLDAIAISPAEENLAMVTYGGSTAPLDCGGTPGDASVVAIDQNLTTNVAQLRGCADRTYVERVVREYGHRRRAADRHRRVGQRPLRITKNHHPADRRRIHGSQSGAPGRSGRRREHHGAHNNVWRFC